MTSYKMRRRMRSAVIMALLFIGVSAIGFGTATGHGGKTHAQEAFTSFQAVQKAAKLYDQLIVAGKLPEDWETDLSSIHILARGQDAGREYVVQFKRAGGDPNSVYFFFDRQGEYSGSNFTGK